MEEMIRQLAARLRLAQNHAPLLRRVAKELQVIYLEHFRKLEARGNAHGYPPRHFWNREVARFTTYGSDASAAELRVDSAAYVHKIKGGRIVPKRAKALAIPKSARAYAAGAPRVSGLPLVFIPDINKRVIGWLVEHERFGTTGKRKGKLANSKTLGTIHYLLVPYVDQPAQADALPPQTTRRTRIREMIRAYMAAKQ